LFAQRTSAVTRSSTSVAVKERLITMLESVRTCALARVILTMIGLITQAKNKYNAPKYRLVVR
jgi:hypothetical protein